MVYTFVSVTQSETPGNHYSLCTAILTRVILWHNNIDDHTWASLLHGAFVIPSFLFSFAYQLIGLRLHGM